MSKPSDEQSTAAAELGTQGGSAPRENSDRLPEFPGGRSAVGASTSAPPQAVPIDRTYMRSVIGRHVRHLAGEPAGGPLAPYVKGEPASAASDGNVLVELTTFRVRRGSRVR